MPLDPSLDDLAGQQGGGSLSWTSPPQDQPWTPQFDTPLPWPTDPQPSPPPQSSQLNPSLPDIASMTHQPEQPNPAPGILKGIAQPIKDFNDLLGWLMTQQPGMTPGPDLKQQIYGTAGLGLDVIGGGIGAAEEGALGVAGGRIYLREIPKKPPTGPYAQLIREMMARDTGQTVKSMDMIDETGSIVGNAKATRRHGDNKLYVDWTGAGGRGPWSMGTSEMLSFMSELQHEFPGIEWLKANRVSGAREGDAASGTKGAKELFIPKHRRVTPGTPRDPPPEPGTINPITKEREKQWRERNQEESTFYRSFGDSDAVLPSRIPRAPSDPRGPGPTQHLYVQPPTGQPRAPARSLIPEPTPGAIPEPPPIPEPPEPPEPPSQLLPPQTPEQLRALPPLRSAPPRGSLEDIINRLYSILGIE